MGKTNQVPITIGDHQYLLDRYSYGTFLAIQDVQVGLVGVSAGEDGQTPTGHMRDSLPKGFVSEVAMLTLCGNKEGRGGLKSWQETIHEEGKDDRIITHPVSREHVEDNLPLGHDVQLIRIINDLSTVTEGDEKN
jgi:hypothetical protein